MTKVRERSIVSKINQKFAFNSNVCLNYVFRTSKLEQAMSKLRHKQKIKTDCLNNLTKPRLWWHESRSKESESELTRLFRLGQLRDNKG